MLKYSRRESDTFLFGSQEYLFHRLLLFLLGPLSDFCGPLFLVGVFEENARLLQWLVFFRQLNAIGPRFCSFVQHHQLKLRTSKTYSKRQKLVQNKNINVQNLENIGSPSWCYSLGFFSELCDFFLKFFGFHQRFSPSFVSIFCNTMDVKKFQRVTTFTFFGSDTVQKSHLKFFSEIFQNLPKVPSFFFIFCNQLEFHKAQRVPLLQF